jgi:hypothetical protein
VLPPGGADSARMWKKFAAVIVGLLVGYWWMGDPDSSMGMYLSICHGDARLSQKFIFILEIYSRVKCRYCRPGSHHTLVPSFSLYFVLYLTINLGISVCVSVFLSGYTFSFGSFTRLGGSILWVITRIMGYLFVVHAMQLRAC